MLPKNNPPTHRYRLDEPVLSMVTMLAGLYIGLFHIYTLSDPDWTTVAALAVLGLCMCLLGLYQLLAGWFGTTEMRRSGALASYLLWGAFNAIILTYSGWSPAAMLYAAYTLGHAGIYLGYRTEYNLPGLVLAAWGMTLFDHADGVPQPMLELAPAAAWGAAMALAGLYGYWCHRSARAIHATGVILIFWMLITTSCLYDWNFCRSLGGVLALVGLLGLVALAVATHAAMLFLHKSYHSRAFQ